MKKFIPYIFITAFTGTFLALSFSAPFSENSLGPKVAEAQTLQGPTINTDANDQFDTSKYAPYVPQEIKSNGDLNAFVNQGEKPVEPIRGDSSWSARLVDASIGYGMSLIASLVYSISMMILNMSAFLMEAVIHFTVTNFKANIDNIGVIDTGYKIVLNLANMIFIFILLYIAIKTILGMGGDTKKLLTSVIVVALLINFSLFMTKVIIDASNVLSIGFLNAIKTDVGENKVAVGSVASAWMSGLRLQTEAYNPNADVIKNDTFKGFHYVTMTIQYLGGATFNLVAAFVFFAVSFLFITRFIALFFYLIFSPVAFLGMISDELKEHSSKWWKGLQNQVIFAPAFLLIAYLVSAIIKSGALWKAVGGVQAGNNATFLTAIGTGFTSGFAIVMNYIILIALMLGGLIAAKAMAAQGSAGMVGYADKARGWMQGAVGGGLGRNVIGRGAYLASNTNYMKDLESKHPWLGGLARKQIENVAGASFGGAKGGYATALEEKIKKQVARSKRFEYEGEDTKRLVEEIKTEEGEQEKRRDSVPLEKISQINTKKKYEELAGKDEETLKKLKLEAETMQRKFDQLGHLAGGEQYEKELENAKAKIKSIELAKDEYTRAQDKYEALNNEIDSSDRKIKNAKKSLEGLQNKYKTEYTKNLPFEHWGRNWRAWDKVFPSYTKAAKQIRKGEKTVQELLDEARKKTGEIKEGGGEKKEEKKE